MTAAHEGWPMTPERRRERNAPPQAGCDDGACWCWPVPTGREAQAALDVLGRERNTWARQMADLRDERDSAITERDEMRSTLGEVSTERDVAQVRADAAEAKVRAVQAAMERAKTFGVYPVEMIAWADLRAALSTEPTEPEEPTPCPPS